MSFGVEADEADKERALSVVRDGAAELAGVLDRFAAAIEKRSTSQVSVYPDRKSRRGPERWRASIDTQLDVADFAVLSDLISATGRIELVRVSGAYRHLRPTSPTFRTARMAAITDALERARDYAAVFGSNVDRLVEIADEGMASAGGRQMRGGKAAMASSDGMEFGDGPEFDLEPTLQTVHGSVQARFTLTEPTLPPDRRAV